MTTPDGRAHCINRLASCPDLAALARVWGQLGVTYQRDDAVCEFRDKLEKQFEQEGQAA